MGVMTGRLGAITVGSWVGGFASNGRPVIKERVPFQVVLGKGESVVGEGEGVCAERKTSRGCRKAVVTMLAWCLGRHSWRLNED